MYTHVQGKEKETFISIQMVSHELGLFECWTEFSWSMHTKHQITYMYVTQHFFKCGVVYLHV